MSEETHKGPNVYALLIGIDCYLPNERSGTPNQMNLSGCVRDINRVEQFLHTQLGLPESNILKLTATDGGAGEPVESAEKWPTRGNIVDAFERLGELAGPGDCVYIHYSGHGGRVKTPPRFEHIKGGAGFDEALVPADFDYKSDKFLRDVELAHILRGYVERGLVVTVVLDSCHSGGATRAEGGPGLREKNLTAVRSVGVINEVFQPPETLVAPEGELASSWQDSSRKTARDFDVGDSWVMEPKGYVLLAACRPSEYAYEHAFDGAKQTGVLTYWLLDSLKSLGADVTFKALYDRVLAKVHSHFQHQTPQLQGDADRLVFGGERAHSPHSAAVMEVGSAQNEVVLNVGQAQGVSKGARFAIYPQCETDFTRVDRRRALASVTVLGATDSRATITERLRDEDVEQGDQAVMLEPGESRVQRTVRLVPRRAGSNGSRCLIALEEVENSLARREGRFVRIAPDDSSADFIVSVGEDDEYVISDAGGGAIQNLRPALKAGDAGASERVADRLVHLAKYFNVYELENRDPYSPLRRQLTVELLGVQTDYVMGDKPAPSPLKNGAGPATVKAGEWVFLKIQNNSPQVLNVTALDLRPNWSIRQLYPVGAAFYEPMDPGQNLTLPLRAGLPQGYEEGRGVIKVLATVGASNFRWLELSALGELHKSSDVWRGEPANPLEEFLAALMHDGPGSRDFTFEAAASHEWTAVQVELNLHRV